VKIAGLVAFYNEEVDLFVDNQPQQRPVTKFSRKERTTMPNETAPNENAHQTRLERILGVQLAEDAVRQWPPEWRRPGVPQHLDRRAPRWEGGPRDRLLG
jgi:hypothetical protein